MALRMAKKAITEGVEAGPVCTFSHLNQDSKRLGLVFSPLFKNVNGFLLDLSFPIR